MKHMHYALTPAQLGKLGCDNAPSSMMGHAGRCKSRDDHDALLRQGIGISGRVSLAERNPEWLDAGRPEMRPR